MRNWIIKIAVSVVVIAIAVSALVIFQKQNDPVSDSTGMITVELIDLEGRTEQRQFAFEEGDTLESLIKRHFEVRYDNAQYGAVLLGIDFIQTDFTTTYISIYVNGTYANYGLSSLPLEAGSVYSFREERV